MVEPVHFVLDKKNSYILSQSDIHISKYNFYFAIATFTLFWFYIYHNKKLSNKAISVGVLSLIIIFALHKSEDSTIYLDADNKNWFIYKDNGENTITNFSSIKKDVEDDLNLKDFNTKDTGLIVNKKFVDKLKKQDKTISKKEFLKKEIVDNVQDLTSKDIIGEHILDDTQSAAFQVYGLITILFTILSLTWHTDKKLFSRMLEFFLLVILLSIPSVYSFFWVGSYITFENLFMIKKHFLFLSLSLTLAILTELLIIYS